MLYYWTCSSIMHDFPKNLSVTVRLSLILVLKYNVNIWGGGGVRYPAVILHLACAVLEWTILLYHAGPE